MDQLPAVARVFAYLSLLTIGGGMAAFPEMKNLVVDVHHWMTFPQLIHLYSVGQLAPGPNMMVVTLLGWRLAGFWGALVATLAKFTPSSLITGFTLRIWDRFRNAPWRRAVQTGLVPITVGLVASSAALIATTAAITPVLVGVTAAVAALASATKLHPLWLLALGAACGLLGVGFG